MSATLFVLRFLMAGLFILFGASKFYPFMPTPAIPADAARFLAALISSGYLWQMVGAVEMLGGSLILWERTRLVGALLLLPVIANIVPYLWLLAQTVPGIPMGLFLILMEAVMLWQARDRLRVLVFN